MRIPPIVLACIGLSAAAVAGAQEATARWSGAIVAGEQLSALSIELRRAGDGWTATFSLPDENVRDMPAPAARISSDSVVVTFRAGAIELLGQVHGDSLGGVLVSGERRTPVALGREGSPVAARLAERVAAAAAAARPSLQLVERGEGVVDEAALARLVEAAGASHSDALVVMRDGKLVGSWHSGGERRPIEAMSATKSIVGLAVGRLITTGAIESLDLPVSTWYPEWRDGRKGRVTLRHLLAHTSGIQANPTTEEIYASDDFVQLALDAEIVSEPGERFFYNNKATNLIAGVVERASGRKLDDYLREELFAPMGITHFSWTRDRAGNPHGMAGFQAHAQDLARLGQLTLQRGVWNGERLIDAAYLEESVRSGATPDPGFGLLWMLVPEWTAFEVGDEQIRSLRAAGMADSVVTRAHAMRGRFTSSDELRAAAERAFGPAWQQVVAEARTRGAELFRRTSGPVVGHSAEGYLGQYIVVYPASGLVAVRMIRGGAGYDPSTDSFLAFRALVRQLVP